MTNHSRSSQPAPTAPTLALGYTAQPMMIMPFAFMVVPFGASLPVGAQLQVSAAPTPAPAAPAPAPAPAAQSDAPASGAKSEDKATTVPAAATRPPGPFLANEVFSVTPTEPLGPIEEEVAAPEWYAITRGRFVGVVDQYALSAVAISGVAHGARKAYTTQHLALAAFNQALTWGGVQVV
ncbi:hypothetical protein C8F04DRAFT_1195722 [Mycena alexandri]|uniref:Uncharacterized protein n=1 Tax=Mycena alexandri TaxID=1745969 RepID=A0AAD6S633_9AGAR|nr:hypothetical protein C8F04DRAFT_1195722 [Mycena alexandri]